MDFIYIHEIKAYGYIGFFEAEQVLGQWFSVDVRLKADLSSAVYEDDLEQTVDYTTIINLVRQKIMKSRCALIETLAANIVEDILNLGKVNEVQLKLTKLAPPIPDFSGSVSVELTRTR